MTAGRWDIAVEQGAAFPQSFLIEDDNGPLVLTGCTAALQVRVDLGDPTALLTLTTQNGGLALDGPNGTITPDFDSNPLIPGLYVYDLKLYDAGGKPARLLQGTITFIGAVTTP